MPYCDDCGRFWNPTSMGKGGECPTCGRVIAEAPRTPWHFKLLLAGLTLYLGWRAVQGVEWLLHHL
ncbi:MAG TPA: hypothetical protein VHN98_01885 [Acidimicrobiales bacterium]|nr:hypothetical protein [Acidimicrobiales bacterium]